MLRLDDGRFAKHFAQFVSLAGAGVGLGPYVESLEAKHQLFANALVAQRRLDLEAAATLLELVFTARRRLYPLIEIFGAEQFGELAAELVHGEALLGDRVEAFCEALPYPEVSGREGRATRRKLRGAALDFAAELLHFADPVAHPLMTRWVWDANSSSGALREFMDVPDTVARIELAASPRTFTETRAWLTERIGEQGIYRDRHWWADLILGMAYVSYFRAMTGGTLGSDFTRASAPSEQLRKLLGIDGERTGGRSRVRRASALH